MNSSEIFVSTQVPACPWPYTFRDNSKVLAFLYLHDDLFNPKWTFTQTNSFAVDETEVNRYSMMFEKLPEILRLKEDSPERMKQTVAWYAECAKYPETRCHGVLGLERVQFYQNLEGLPDPVTLQQKIELMNVLISESPPKQYGVTLISFLEEVPSREFDEYLLNGLRLSYQKEWHRAADEIVKVLPKRLNFYLTLPTQHLRLQYRELKAEISRLSRKKSDEAELRIASTRAEFLRGMLYARVYDDCKAEIEKRDNARN